MDVRIRCPACRSDKFLRTGNPKRDEPVTCVGCGLRFPYGELEDRAVEAARRRLAETFPNLRGK